MCKGAFAPRCARAGTACIGAGGATCLAPRVSHVSAARHEKRSAARERGTEGRLRAARYACRLFRSPRSLARARARRRILSARNPRPTRPQAH